MGSGAAGGRTEALPPKSPIGQGRLTHAENLAVEHHAMRLAEAWLQSNGYPFVKDVSRSESWDLEARTSPRSAPLYVEVKGTTGSKVDVEVTANEVVHAQDHPGDTLLSVVTDIVLSKGKEPKASGGREHRWHPWKPSPAELKVTRYRWRPLS